MNFLALKVIQLNLGFIVRWLKLNRIAIEKILNYWIQVRSQSPLLSHERTILLDNKCICSEPFRERDMINILHIHISKYGIVAILLLDKYEWPSTINE